MIPSLKMVLEGIEDEAGSDPVCLRIEVGSWSVVRGGCTGAQPSGASQSWLTRFCAVLQLLELLTSACEGGSVSRVNKWMSLRGLGSSHVYETEESWCSNFWVLRSK